MKARKELTNEFTGLWNRQIADSVWTFLPEAVREILPADVPKEALVREISGRTTSGLIMWNVGRALGVRPAALPKVFFEGKAIASVVCDKADLSGVSFDGSTIHDVIFERCELLGTTFHGARIKKIKFIDCGKGAAFDKELLVDDDSEVTMVRGVDAGHEVYVGPQIAKIVGELRGETTPRAKLPTDLAKQALVVILTSLFKADKHRLDYPEKQKIENRLRAWLQTFDLTQEQTRELLRAFSEGFEELKHEGWICQNPNRARTFVPCADHKPEVGRVCKSRSQTQKLGARIERLLLGMSNQQRLPLVAFCRAALKS